MKVLILANDDIGLYQFRKELISEIIKKKHNVYIALPNGAFIEKLMNIGCKYIETPVDRRGVNPITDFKLLISYFKLIRKIHPDLVITYTIKPNVYGGICCRVLKIPYAVNITGLGTAFQKDNILKTFVSFLYKVGLKNAQKVLFENIGNLNILVNERIVDQKQTVLLNGAGVNLEHYSLIPYPMQKAQFNFLFVGRVMREKGIDELISAVRTLNKEGYHCRLDVVGGYEENYRKAIDDCEEEGWLKYHGYQEDVRPFIAKCDCFVLPSWHEGMANTNLECAASGRPVITSAIPGCKEAVEDGVTGFLCESKNDKSLLASMKRFIDLSYEQRKQMGINGRMRMESMFDKRTVVNMTMEALRL